GLSELLNLGRVICLGLDRAHAIGRTVAIAPRSQIPADHDLGPPRFEPFSDVQEKFDRALLNPGERLRIIPQLGGPIRICPPSRRLQHQAYLLLSGNPGVALEITAEYLSSFLRAQETERREVWQRESLMKDEG